MDLNKEIKLSDLVRRPKKKAKAPGVTKPSSEKRKRRRKQEIVGLKIGASQIAASRVVNNGASAKLVQLARVPLEPGDRRRRGGAERRRARDGARPLLHREQAAAPRHPARHRHQPHRHAHARHRRHRRRAPARATPFASARTRRCRSRSTRPCSTTTSSARPSTSPAQSRAASCSRPPTRSRSTTTSRRAGRRSLELSGIDVEAFALLRAVAPRRGRRRRRARRRPRRRLDRSRPLDAGDLGRHRLRFHARPRLGRLEARGRDHAGARADRGRGRAS